MNRPTAAKTRVAAAIGSKYGVNGSDIVLDSFLSDSGEVLIVKLCYELDGNRYAVVVDGEYKYFRTLAEAAQSCGL